VSSVRTGKSAKKPILAIVVIAALASLVVPYRIISTRIQQMAAESAGTADPQQPLSPEWKQTIGELKEFVETARGLKFKHEVPVVVESAGAFRERLAAEAEEYGMPESADSYIALKALHLVDGDNRMDALEDPLQDGGTLGYYDAYSKRLVVQGDEPSPFVRQILVHELTHALQDQHFNLNRELNDFDETYLAFESLVEGDATRVENLYLESLSPEERQMAIQEQDIDMSGFGDQAPSRSLETLSMLSSFPYEVGEQFVLEILAEGGQERLDQAFVSPPTTSEQILHPERFLNLQKPVSVEPPDADRDPDEEGVFGERGLLTLLLRDLPEDQAWEAADGWAGDYFVAWRKSGLNCIRLSLVTDSRTDRQELEAALRAWAAGKRLVSIHSGRTIQLRSCA